MMQTSIRVAFCVLMTVALFACSGPPAPPEEDAQQPTLAVDTPVPTSDPAATEESPTSLPENTPDESSAEALAPTATPEPVATPEPLFYNMPSTRLTSATGLYVAPKRSEFIVPVSIPEGETVFVMGKNKNSSHLRVVWNTGVGWIPVSFTDYIGQRDKMDPLPVFEREPPQCAEPVTTQFGLKSTWTSDKKQRIAVVVDLFRSRYGEFPNSHITLVVNGVPVDSSKRQIVEQGQFSLKDVVFTVPQDLQAGDELGYLLETSSDEPLTFMATIFSVPVGCQWEGLTKGQ